MPGGLGLMQISRRVHILVESYLVLFSVLGARGGRKQ